MTRLPTADNLRADMYALKISSVDPLIKKTVSRILGLIDGIYGNDLIEQDWRACQKLEEVLLMTKENPATEILKKYLHP